jgi:hypothetical protein
MIINRGQQGIGGGRQSTAPQAPYIYRHLHFYHPLQSTPVLQREREREAEGAVKKERQVVISVQVVGNGWVGAVSDKW